MYDHTSAHQDALYRGVHSRQPIPVRPRLGRTREGPSALPASSALVLSPDAVSGECIRSALSINPGARRSRGWPAVCRLHATARQSLNRPAGVPDALSVIQSNRVANHGGRPTCERWPSRSRTRPGLIAKCSNGDPTSPGVQTLAPSGVRSDGGATASTPGYFPIRPLQARAAVGPRRQVRLAFLATPMARLLCMFSTVSTTRSTIGIAGSLPRMRPAPRLGLLSRGPWTILAARPESRAAQGCARRFLVATARSRRSPRGKGGRSNHAHALSCSREASMSTSLISARTVGMGTAAAVIAALRPPRWRSGPSNTALVILHRRPCP